MSLIRVGAKVESAGKWISQAIFEIHFPALSTLAPTLIKLIYLWFTNDLEDID